MSADFLNRISKVFAKDRGDAQSPAPPSSPRDENAAESGQRTGRKRRRPRRKPDRGKEPGAEAPAAEVEWSPDQFQVSPQEGCTRFHDLDLPNPVMRAIHELGFEYCTPIQAKVLPLAIAGSNIAGRAQTGTGKTAAFLIAVFTRFLRYARKTEQGPGVPRALVLAPTRELVIQIVKDAEELGNHAGIRCLAVYGGMDYGRQQRQLQEGQVDLIAATPGRLLDFCSKKLINLRKVEFLVIDEADRMLDMGFIPDVRRIVRQTPRKDLRYTMLFSATLQRSILDLAEQWMPRPTVVEVEPEQVEVKSVAQDIYMVEAEDKFKVLYNLLAKRNMQRVLVFGNRRDRTGDVVDRLQAYGISCELLSGAVPQRKRLQILEDFRAGKVRVLVATDVAGRGLHVEDISHVINFDLPYEQQDYVHRIGRTGRAGATGTAISFACEEESFVIPEIEEYLGHSLPCKHPAEDLLEPLPALPPGSRRRSSKGRGGSGGGSSRSGSSSHRGSRSGRGSRPGGSSRSRSRRPRR